MATTGRSGNVAELQRMFSNLDSNVIASVLAANNGQVDLTIDHLLTMSIDTENANNIHQSTPITPLRQLPAVPNLYEDDPPPYPGHETISHNRATPMQSLPLRTINNSRSRQTSNSSEHSTHSNIHERDIQVQRWKTAYGQYRICYTGDLPDDFLRVKFLSPSEIKQNLATNEKQFSTNYFNDQNLLSLLQDEEFLHELRHNKDFITTLRSDEPARSSQRRSFNQFSTKPLPLPTPPTIESAKTPKVRAKMLQNVLTQIEQGQTLKTSMVPEESITQNEEYSYGKDNREPMPLPPAPYIGEFDPLRVETNEEFIFRLKNMGKNSMEKFNQIARRFSMKKSSTNLLGKYSKQPM